MFGGIASLGTAEYEDEYAKTPQGWRFASRSVITTPEKAAGLSALDLIAIEKLAGNKLGDRYEPDQNGVQRLMTSGRSGGGHQRAGYGAGVSQGWIVRRRGLREARAGSVEGEVDYARSRNTLI